MYGETFTSRGQRRAEVIFSHLLHEELLSWWCCSSSTVTLIWNKVQQCLMKERKQRSAAGCYGVNVCTEMLSSAQAVHPQQKHSKWHQTTRYFTSPKKVLLKDDKWVECEVRHSGCRHRQEMVKTKQKQTNKHFPNILVLFGLVFFTSITKDNSGACSSVHDLHVFFLSHRQHGGIKRFVFREWAMSMNWWRLSLLT